MSIPPKSENWEADHSSNTNDSAAIQEDQSSSSTALPGRGSVRTSQVRFPSPYMRDSAHERPVVAGGVLYDETGEAIRAEYWAVLTGPKRAAHEHHPVLLSAESGPKIRRPRVRSQIRRIGVDESADDGKHELSLSLLLPDPAEPEECNSDVTSVRRTSVDHSGEHDLSLSLFPLPPTESPKYHSDDVTNPAPVRNYVPARSLDDSLQGVPSEAHGTLGDNNSEAARSALAGARNAKGKRPADSQATESAVPRPPRVREI